MATAEPKNTVAATLADPQYKAGRKLIDDGRLEEAVNFFSGLLETRVQVLSGDEMNPSLAPLYYEYGNSLLYNAEESGAVFGDAITDAEQKKKAMAIVEAKINGQAAAAGGGSAGGGAAGANAEEGEGGGAGTGQEAPSPDQEAEEDLEIAWENLEMARRIYSELELTEEIRTAIAKVRTARGERARQKKCLERIFEFEFFEPKETHSKTSTDERTRRPQYGVVVVTCIDT